MNANITDRSSGNRIDFTERYQEGTITTTGYVDNGYFKTTVITLLHNGYRSEERITGNLYADGSQVNVQRFIVSESKAYAPHQRSMSDYREYDNYDEYAPQRTSQATNNRQSLDTYQPYEAYEANWRPATR